MQPDFTYKPEQESIAVIKRVQQLTSHVWLKTKLSNGLLILAEIVCYLLAIGLVIVAILLPNGKIPVAEWVSEGVTFTVSAKKDEFILVFTILRVTIGILGMLMIIPAMLFRKVRKKNYVLEEVNTICGEYLKKAG